MHIPSDWDDRRSYMPQRTLDVEFTARAEPHRRELLVHCYQMLGSVQDAQDLVQETMLRAWRAYDRYEPDLASMRTWLYRIATNACLPSRDGRAVRFRPGWGSGSTTRTPPSWRGSKCRGCNLFPIACSVTYQTIHPCWPPNEVACVWWWRRCSSEKDGDPDANLLLASEVLVLTD